MFKGNNIALLSLLLCTALLIMSCDDKGRTSNNVVQTQTIIVQTPTISKLAAIRLAKAEADKLPSPPRKYYFDVSRVQNWPSEDGILVTSYAVTGHAMDPITSPMTFTTAISLADAGANYDVAFSCSWQNRVGEAEHTWLFHVTENAAIFVTEEGDDLPAQKM